MKEKLDFGFKKALKSINKKLLIEKCEKYKIKFNKLNPFFALCCFYMKERIRMRDWELSPEDFLNPDMMLQDEIIKYLIAKKSKSKQTEKIKKGIYEMLEIFLILESINTNSEILKQKSYIK